MGDVVNFLTGEVIGKEVELDDVEGKAHEARLRFQMVTGYVEKALEQGFDPNQCVILMPHKDPEINCLFIQLDAEQCHEEAGEICLEGYRRAIELIVHGGEDADY